MSLRKKQNSLGSKVGLGFGVVGLVLIGAILFTIYQVSRLDTLTEHLIETRTTGSTVTQNLIQSIDSSLINQRDWLLTANTRYQDEFENSWAKGIRPNLSVLKAYSINNPDIMAPAAADGIEQRLEKLSQLQLEINSLDISSDNKAAAARFNREVMPMAAAITGQLAGILDSQNARTVGSLIEVQSRIDDLLATDWAFLLMGLLLGSLLGIILTKSITKPIHQMVGVAKKLAQGKLDQNIDIKGTSEFEILSETFNEMVKTLQSLANVTERMAMGDYSQRVKVKSVDDRLAITVNQMLDSFNQIVLQANAIASGDYNNEIKPRSEADTLGTALMNMTRTLQQNKLNNRQENWLKDGVAELTSVLSNTQDIKELTKLAISSISRYLDAGMGLIYLYDKNSDCLKLYGSHAYQVRDSLANEFKPGEGIVGQVALENKPILLQNVSTNDAVISTGTKQLTPKNIYTFPFSYENNLMGVIELASHNDFDELKIRYIEELIPLLASQIHAANQQTLTTKLYNESKSLADKLQAQQEELRVANEELEQQTQVLQASEEELRQKDIEQQAINKQLEERTVALEKQKAEIEEKTKEVQKTSEALAQKNIELEQASKYKSEFLANMSHELRTPLNSLLILAKLFADNEDGNLSSDQVEAAQIMHKSGQDLLTLINDILDLAKVEAGKIEIQKSSVPIESFTETMQRDFGHVAEKKEIGFVTEITGDLPEMIYTDDHRVLQIIRNLISNAIKFTSHGEVKFTISRPKANTVFKSQSFNKDNCISLSVSDTGIGIPKDKQDSIFESFQQADGTTSRKYGGTGLGLSISVQLAALLGGEVGLESEENKGSCFTLYLPDTSDSDVPLVHYDVVVDTPQESTIQPQTESAPETKDSIPKVRKSIDNKEDNKSKGKCLLIIEDDPQFTKILQTICKKKGFESLHAKNGTDGLSIAQQHIPNGILLDLGLPDMNGLEVLEKLKSNPKLQNIPVHVISASDESPTAIKKGALGYLTKPVSQEQLDIALEKIESVANKNIRDILIVEDDTALLKSMTNLLSAADVNITGVTTGQEALDNLTNKHFDCVILDLGLPDMSGQDVLTKYQATDPSDSPAIIIHTGQNLSQDECENINHMVDSIIIKGTDASVERLQEETQLFLHRVEETIPTTQTPAAKTNANQEAVLENKKLLIVDDDMRNSFALSKVLKGKGLDISMAANGLKALESLDKYPETDIVLMDIMMPVMDGYEAIQEIRKQERFKSLPIIALTAKAMVDDREKCISVGASDFLSKPIDIEKLVTMIRAWL